MSQDKPKSEPKRIWICSWSKCRKISQAMSKNGYCQKCYEGTQIPFIQFADFEAAQSRIKELEAENIGLLQLVDGQSSELQSLRAQNARYREALEKISDPRKRDHQEPDKYTECACIMNIAEEALGEK